jgi:hypothetical protein
MSESALGFLKDRAVRLLKVLKPYIEVRDVVGSDPREL